MTTVTPSQRMIWSNLPKNKCPKCGKDLTTGLTTSTTPDGVKMLAHSCGFTISEPRFSELSAKIKEDENNKSYIYQGKRQNPVDEEEYIEF